MNQDDAARKAIEIMGGVEGLIYTKAGFWNWRPGQGHWMRIEMEELVRQRIQEVVPPRLLTANLEGSVFRLVKTKVARSVDFDRPPHEFAINVKNGTLHWSCTNWELREHSRADFLTGCIPVEYSPDAEAPAFGIFLTDIFAGDFDAAEKCGSVLAMIGYTLTASTRFERFVILQGKSSSNGKSTLLSVIEALLGKQNVSSVLPSSMTERFQKATLHGKLANIVAELPLAQVLPDDVVKAVVSGDAMTAENKGRDPFHFRPYSTLWYGTNYMPFSRDFSRALFDRAIVIAMNRRFDRTDTGETGTVKAIRGLADKLKTELPGILNLALSSLAAALLAGSGIPEPASSIEAKKAWRRDIDPVVMFAEDCLVLPTPGTVCWHESQSDGWPKSREVYVAYLRWAEATGTKATLTQNWLTQRLEGLFPSVKAMKQDGDRVLEGVQLDSGKAFQTVGATIA